MSTLTPDDDETRSNAAGSAALATAGERTPGARPLTAAVLARFGFRCPRCGSDVRDEQGIRCLNGHITPVRDGYVDASPEAVDEEIESTFRSFGYEWTVFDRVEPEDALHWERYFRDVPLEELRGRPGLDAGCGKGRFTRFTARHLGSIVALDGSRAVESAARNLADLPNALVVKADLREAPFENESFAFVSCLGVLHHLPDPKAGFAALTRLLSPGGLILVYLYSRPTKAGVRSLGLAAAAGLRRITVRVPHRALRMISMPIAVVLRAGVVVPGEIGDRLGSPKLAGLPLQAYRRQPIRTLWLDTFDRLSAPMERRVTWPEVEPWFQEAGMRVEAVREDAGLFILARKAPSPGVSAATTGA